jgi:hypothetical protein
MCYNGTPDEPNAFWLCGDCGRHALARIAETSQQDACPMNAVDLGRPHAWTLFKCHEVCLTDLVYMDPLADADFVVPAAATHMLDPNIMPALTSWVNNMTEADFCGISSYEIGSLRGWMPLKGSHTVSLGREAGSRVVKRARVAMVCCDRRNFMWGAVVLVEFSYDMMTMRWHHVEDDLGALLSCWRRHLLRVREEPPGRSWVEWSGETYIDAAERLEEGGYHRAW